MPVKKRKKEEVVEATPVLTSPAKRITKKPVMPKKKTITKKKHVGVGLPEPTNGMDSKKKWSFNFGFFQKAVNFAKQFFLRIDRITIGGGKEKAYFLEYLAMLINSGMDPASAMESIGKDIKTRWMRNLVRDAQERVSSGTAIATALDEAHFLPRHVISLLRIGEKSGRLSDNLKAVVLQQQKDAEFRGKVQSAMMYPIFVLAVTMIVGTGIAWFILPQLAVVFSSLEMDLPFVTRILIAVGLFLRDHGSIFVPIFFASFLVLLYVVFGMPKTKVIGQWILFHLPGIRLVVQEVELSRTGFIMGTLLQAGLPLVEAIESLRQATVFYQYRKFYATLGIALNAGDSWEQVFDSYKRVGKLIPNPIQQMIAVAERSGTLPETLVQIGNIYSAKTDQTTKNLSVILEPLLLIIVWLGVVGVALAVILPIYSLIGNLTSVASGDTVSTETTTSPTPLESILSGDKSIESFVGTVTDSLQDVMQSAGEYLGIYTVAQPIDVTTEVITPTMLRISSPVGYANVRSVPSTAGRLITQVLDGAQYEWTVQEGGWYQIKLPDGSFGWIFDVYGIDITPILP